MRVLGWCGGPWGGRCGGPWRLGWFATYQEVSSFIYARLQDISTNLFRPATHNEKGERLGFAFIGFSTGFLNWVSWDWTFAKTWWMWTGWKPISLWIWLCRKSLTSTMSRSWLLPWNQSRIAVCPSTPSS